MVSIAVCETSVEKRLKTIASFEDLIVFLVVLFIGADIFQFNVGVSIRIDQILAVVASVVLLIKGRLYLPLNKFFLSFLGLCVLSCVFSDFKVIGVLYCFWIIFNYVFILGVVFSYIKHRGIERFFKIFRITIYIQVVLVVVQFFLEAVGKPIPFFSTGTFHGIPRPAIWFYETSYFATYLTFWLVISVFMAFHTNQKLYYYDCIIAVVGIVFCTATTGFIALALCACILVLSLIHNGKYLALVRLLLFAIVILVIGLAMFNDIIQVFIMRIFRDGLAGASGGRIDGYKETWTVFVDNWLLGVGPGAYGLYLGHDRSYVPSNITLELLATCGIFATIFFYLFVLSFSWKACKISKIYNRRLLKYFGIALVVFLIILQANQNYLRLYLWMFLGMIAGYIDSLKKKEKSV